MWTRLGSVLAYASQQACRGHVQGTGQPYERTKLRGALACLKAGQGGAVHVGLGGERFLAHVRPQSLTPQVCGEAG